MTLIVAVSVPTGIILSGDSRMTAFLTVPATMPSQPTPTVPATPSQVTPTANPPNLTAPVTQSPTPTAQMPLAVSDTANKVFLLFGKFGVGVYGTAYINDMPVGHTIQDFEAKTTTVPATPQDLANSLLQHLQSMTPVPALGLTVIGYDNLDQWILIKEPLANSFTRVNIVPNTQNVTYMAQWSGDTLVATRLFSDPQYHPACQYMTVQDGIDLSRHIIRTTIDQLRFEPRYATVGGPIDTLLITQSKATFIAQKDLHSV
jgi:hypothetical protein